MITDFYQVLGALKKRRPVYLSVAMANDREIVSALDMAYGCDLIRGAVLTGDVANTKRIFHELNIDPSPYEFVEESSQKDACRRAVQFVRDGEADLPMKGNVDSSVMLKEVLNSQRGVSVGGLISHVGVYQIPTYNRLLLMGDSAVNIAPSMLDKVEIINNCVKVAHALGIDVPKVAIVCAVEKINAKMSATVDAIEITRMFEKEDRKDSIVYGPLALDNAVSPEAAKHKGIGNPVAGQADILIVPNIEAGNIFNKSLEYFANAQKAGILMGASKPIILTSRASNKQSKLNSIALGVLVAGNQSFE